MSSDVNLFRCVRVAFQDILNKAEHLLMEHHVKVGQPSELRDVDRLLLLLNPAFAEACAQAVYCVVPVSINKVHGVCVGKLLVVNIGDWSWKPHTIHAPHFNTRRVEITGEVLGVLPHIPEGNRIKVAVNHTDTRTETFELVLLIY